MNFNKVISNMQELQNKIEVYENKNKRIDETIILREKDITKLEKKLEKEQDEISKHIIDIKLLIMKEIINRFKEK